MDLMEMDPFAVAWGPRDAEEEQEESEQQWRRFLQTLADAELLTEATAQRFATQYHGRRTLAGFQQQLQQWTRTPHSQGIDAALETLDEQTQFLSRVLEKQSKASAPAELGDIIRHEHAMRNELHALECEARSLLAERWRWYDLVGPHGPASLAADCSAATNAWRTQIENARFVQKHKPIGRRLNVQLHAFDASTHALLLETFSTRLKRLSHVQLTLGTVHRKPQPSQHEQHGRELVVTLRFHRQSCASEGEVAYMDNLIAAHNQLVLSPYFQQYLGSDKVKSSKEEWQSAFYFELLEASSLKETIDIEGPMTENSALFRFYARELLLGLIDLLEHSTHQLLTRITLDNVMISNAGRRLFLGKLDFGDVIDSFQTDICRVQQEKEATLLEDLALMLFAMLHRVTVPDNISAFRSQYLVKRDDKFTFEYDLTDAVEDERLSVNHDVFISRGDRFSIYLENESGCFWQLRRPIPSLLICLGHQLSPITTEFEAIGEGEAMLLFASSGENTRTLQANVHIQAASFRLESGKLHTLISSCSSSPPRASLRLLLDHHEYFQPESDEPVYLDDPDLQEDMEASTLHPVV